MANANGDAPSEDGEVSTRQTEPECASEKASIAEPEAEPSVDKKISLEGDVSAELPVEPKTSPESDTSVPKEEKLNSSPSPPPSKAADSDRPCVIMNCLGINSASKSDESANKNITENNESSKEPEKSEENIRNEGVEPSTLSAAQENVANDENVSDKKDESSKEEEKESEENWRNGEEGLKIQMVTTLGSSDTFVEPPSGPDSPAILAVNPLESNDRDETSEGNKEPSGKETEELKPVSDSDKDNEQAEVITGDKTISPEYVNTISAASASMKDHGYSRKANGAFNSQSIDMPPKRTLRVIYPKKKVADVSQLKITRISVPVLKNCIQCSKVSQCNTTIDIGGSECYLCSDECVKLHKQVQLSALQRKTAANIPVDKQDLSHESRLCVNCDANVSVLPEEKVLSWEAMEFCNEDCLGKYQLKMWSFCSACKKDVPTCSMGKYCVRFGHEVKQFCSSNCLEEFKKGIKVCSYCQKDLTDGEGFLAPIGDRGQFRDFCSQLCLDEYDSMSRNLPALALKVEACGVCDKTQLVQLQVVTSSNSVNLCSEVCFAAFKFVNTTISSAPCYMCKKYFDKTLPTAVTIYYENDILSFCSKSCMNINILSKRKIVACNWCKVKKYNFDMIRRKSPNGGSTSWCSVNCMTLYQVSMNAITHRSKMNCTQCKKLDVPNLHLTMSDATLRNFCSLECVNKFQAAFAAQGVPANGVFPTGAPKRVVRTRTLIPSQPLDGSSPKSDSGNTVVPVNQSSIPVIPLKKPEIKVINPVNGASPSSGMVQQEGSSTQLVKYQVLVRPPQPPKVANAKLQVRPNMINKSVSVKCNSVSKSVQTEEGEEKKVEGPVLIPIPVPVYVPCPMAMYSIPVPTPFPFPIPVAVPIIIPTTKTSTEQIMADIKRIQEKIPGNPYEAELIMMAEMAEGEKKSSEAEADAQARLSPESSACRGEKRRGTSEGESNGGGPPEKKRREELCDSLEGAIVQQLATSRLAVSLKETLGVSAWRHYAVENGEEVNLLEMRPGELAQALRGFILNGKIPGGGNYTPDQMYYLMLGIQYYLEENGRIDNIFFDTLFDPFIDALNEEAKKFQNMFATCDNVITRVEEEHLWESKQLGPHSPATLIATLIYFNTKYFNLTTVEEHMQLSFSNILKHWKRSPNTSPGNNNNSNGSRHVLLRFYPSQSLLDGNSKKKKVYEQEANEEDPYRCPIHLYEFYLSKCPESVKAKGDLFYMSPERSCVPDSPIWYSTSPLSQDVIERTLNRFKMVKEINLALLSSV